MTEPALPLVEEEAAVADPGHRRALLALAGVAGVAVVGGGAFLLLHGGSSNSADNQAFTPAIHAAHPQASASASPSATASKVLSVYNGSVGDRDPFAVPAAVIAAGSGPAPAAPGASSATAAAAPAASAAAAPAPSALPVTLPVPGAVVPAGGATTTTTTTTVTKSVLPDQFLQLLAARHTATGWVVDVRTAAGVTKNVPTGTKNVGHTLFYFLGADETTGTRTFVFTVGESQGGNVKPNAKESPKKPHADKSTLILHNGVVDGGLYAE